MLREQQLEKASFDLWLTAGDTGNQSDIDRLRRILPIAMKECCTEKQMLYITRFFVDGMMMKDIAVLYGVNKSNVSRGIRLGLRRMRDHLKFCSPELYAAMPRQGMLTQKKINRKK